MRKKSLSPDSRLGLSALGACFLLFSVLTLSHFSSPGVIFDFLEEALAVRLAQKVRNGASIFELIWSLDWPWYHGRLTALMMFPFTALGAGWIFLRLWPVLFGLLSLAVLYDLLSGYDVFGTRDGNPFVVRMVRGGFFRGRCLACGGRYAALLVEAVGNGPVIHGRRGLVPRRPAAYSKIGIRTRIPFRHSYREVMELFRMGGFS